MRCNAKRPRQTDSAGRWTVLLRSQGASLWHSKHRLQFVSHVALFVKGWKVCGSVATAGLGCVGYHSFPFVSPAPTSRLLQQKYSGHQKPLFKKGRYNQLQHHQHHHCYSWISLFSSSFSSDKWKLGIQQMLIFTNNIYIKFSKTEGFFLSRFCKEINQTQEHQTHTHIHTDQQSNVNRKKKKDIITRCLFFIFILLPFK